MFLILVDYLSLYSVFLVPKYLHFEIFDNGRATNGMTIAYGRFYSNVMNLEYKKADQAACRLS